MAQFQKQPRRFSSAFGEYGAKATFFCVGENIVKNPKIFQQLIEEGHGVGNHTHHHLNGWKTDTDDFINDIALCQKQFDKHLRSNVQTIDETTIWSIEIFPMEVTFDRL